MLYIIMIRVGPDLVFLAGCRMSGACQIRPDMPDIRQNEKSGRLIRHCRISGPTLIIILRLNVHYTVRTPDDDVKHYLLL